MITFKIETEREQDGRWLAEVIELPGVLAYGDSQTTAVSRAQALALRVIAERLEHGEAGVSNALPPGFGLTLCSPSMMMRKSVHACWPASRSGPA